MTLEEFQAHQNYAWYLYECKCGETKELKDHTKNMHSLGKSVLEKNKKLCSHTFEDTEHENDLWLRVEQCPTCGQRKLSTIERYYQ